jgi:hypothetical protein
VGGDGSRVTYLSDGIFIDLQRKEGEAYMGVGFGGDVDTGIVTPHTPENVGVAFLDPSA